MNKPQMVSGYDLLPDAEDGRLVGREDDEGWARGRPSVGRAQRRGPDQGNFVFI